VLVLRIALLLVLALPLLGCELRDETVARVGGTKISEEDVERTLEHFEEEFQREGREFPEEGSPEHRALELSALRLLVFREQLEQRAARLGVEISDDEVEERTRRNAGAEEGEGEDEEGEAFLEASARTQLIRERVAERLAAGITVSEEQLRAAARRLGRRPNASLRRELLQQRRNEALTKWTLETQRSIRVEYEDGWGTTTS